jgi:hypothetical protein
MTCCARVCNNKWWWINKSLKKAIRAIWLSLFWMQIMRKEVNSIYEMFCKKKSFNIYKWSIIRADNFVWVRRSCWQRDLFFFPTSMNIFFDTHAQAIFCSHIRKSWKILRNQIIRLSAFSFYPSSLPFFY